MDSLLLYNFLRVPIFANTYFTSQGVKRHCLFYSFISQEKIILLTGFIQIFLKQKPNKIQAYIVSIISVLKSITLLIYISL